MQDIETPCSVTTLTPAVQPKTRNRSPRQPRARSNPVQLDCPAPSRGDPAELLICWAGTSSSQQSKHGGTKGEGVGHQGTSLNPHYSGSSQGEPWPAKRSESTASSPGPRDLPDQPGLQAPRRPQQPQTLFWPTHGPTLQSTKPQPWWLTAHPPSQGGQGGSPHPVDRQPHHLNAGTHGTPAPPPTPPCQAFRLPRVDT
ncbi:hypothetical protein CRENBAI_000804 [Crenichthys baileyi]|uniref:Uncharacterized protein n=1 Tax=Crenichthys baileyi TaxID=28760 RepID=A0AAV9QNV7_9TELE